MAHAVRPDFRRPDAVLNESGHLAFGIHGKHHVGEQECKEHKECEHGRGGKNRTVKIELKSGKPGRAAKSLPGLCFCKPACGHTGILFQNVK